MYHNVVTYRLDWWKCSEGKEWCSLSTVNLASKNLDQVEGVYLIWNPITQRYVRVGQGNVRDRLGKHRADEELLPHLGTDARVTWAVVAPAYRDGVELYLAQRCNPLVGTRFPDDITPIPVNLPGE